MLIKGVKLPLIFFYFLFGEFSLKKSEFIKSIKSRF